MANTLCCIAKGGLGNRLRALSSNMWIARQLNCELDIFWTVSNTMGASFSDIINKPVFQLYEHEDRKLAVEYFERKYAGAQIATISNIHIPYNAFRTNDVVIVDTWGWAILCGWPKKQLNSEIVKQESASILCEFKWHPYVNKNVLEFHQSYKIENCIGVHVRRGDVKQKQWRDRYITEEQYFQSLAQYEDSIFLATEDCKVIDRFQKEYGNRLIRYQCRNFQRSSVEAIQDSLVEMCLLSQCKKIISGPSSFSEVAQYIGCISRDVLESQRK